MGRGANRRQEIKLVKVGTRLPRNRGLSGLGEVSAGGRRAGAPDTPKGRAGQGPNTGLRAENPF